MSNTTVSKLAIALKISSEKLISQLNEAGVNVDKEADEITNDQKMVAAEARAPHPFQG